MGVDGHPAHRVSRLGSLLASSGKMPAFVGLLELCSERKNVLRVCKRLFRFYASRYLDRHYRLGRVRAARARHWRQQIFKMESAQPVVRELAAMDRERREKVLSRMNPAQAMEARQELMRRFNIF